MIIQEQIKIKLGTKNYKYYEEKGYNVYENGKFINGKEIYINSCDIKPTSKIKIRCKCDGCGKIIYRIPDNRNFDNNIDYCSSCSHLMSETIHINRDTLIKETCNSVDKYIKENGSIAGFIKNDKYGYRIKHFKLNLKEICEELGYDWFEVGVNRNSYSFKNKKELINFIQRIIDTEGCFPTCTKLNSYGIWPRTYLKFFDSYEDIRKEMGYVDSLVDNSGYKCKSSYELMFSNYLIKNNIKFKREVKPFKINNFRSDFLLFDENNNKVFIEIWGLLKENPNGFIETQYKKIHDEKIKLYNENNLTLISFYVNDFKTLNIFTKKADKIFKNLKVIKTNELNDYSITKKYHIDEIKNVILKEFGNIEYFPTAKELRDHHMNGVLNAIYKYYGSINKIALELNLLTKRQWCENNHINIITMKKIKQYKETNI